MADINNIETIQDLKDCIAEYLRTPRVPAIKGSELNILLSKTIELVPGGTQTAVEVRDLLITLTGSNRLPASAIKDLPSGGSMTAAEIKTALETLTGTGRLDASAIKNLPGGGSESGLIGEIYSKNNWANLSEFTTNGVTASIVSGKIKLTGNSNDYLKTLDLNHVTLLSRWEQKIRVSIPEPGGDTYGFGIGVRSVNSVGPRGVLVRIEFSTDSERSGKLFMYSSTDSFASDIESINNGIPITGSAGDIIELTLELNGNSLFAIAKNITSKTQNEFSSYFITDNIENLFPNTSKFCIFQFGGDNIVEHYKVSSNVKKNVDYLFIGDSKTHQGSVSDYSKCFVSKIDKYVRNKSSLISVENSGGGNDRTTEVILRLPELVLIKPKKAFLAIGSNDKRYGTTLNDWKDNYSLITSELEAAGIDVYHLLTFPEGILDFSDYVAYINTTFSAEKIIDTNTPLLGISPFIDADFCDGDVHPNDLGNEIIANTIINSGLIDGFITFSAEKDAMVASHGGGNKFTNFALGIGAFFANLTATLSTAIGYKALSKNTTGNYNTAIGAESLMNNVDGLANTAVGMRALKANISGTQNTAVGMQALVNSVADFNTAVGYAVMLNNVGGAKNVALGSGALSTNVNGNLNTAVGYAAMSSNGDGDNNVAVGAESMFNSNGGTRSVGVGNSSLRVNEGGDNVGIGHNVLYFNSSGYANTAIGRSTLQLTTTGSDNTAVGKFAGLNNVTGNGNIFMGAYAGSKETTSDNFIVDDRDRADEEEGRAKAILFGKMATNPADQHLTVNAQLAVSICQEFADNASALSGGLLAGGIYRTGDLLKIVH